MMQAYQELEIKFAEWMDLDPECCVACSSGTAALHLALESLELPPGEVVVPEYTMIACARAVTLANLKPVFIDCNDRLLFSSEKLPGILSRQTRALMPVHIYGRHCNIQQIWERAYQGLGRMVPIIEDMAEIHGVRPHPETEAACWSFYQNKVVAGEEGGIVCFSLKQRAEIARELRCQGFTKEHNFKHRPRGHNYRLANSLALLILESLAQVSENLRKREQIVAWYDEAIPDGLKMPSRKVCWVYDLKIPNMTEEQQTKILQQLNEAGIQARRGFRPMSGQAEYFDPGHYQLNAHHLSSQIIYLPIDPRMARGDAQRNVDGLLEALSTC